MPKAPILLEGITARDEVWDPGAGQGAQRLSSASSSFAVPSDSRNRCAAWCLESMCSSDWHRFSRATGVLKNAAGCTMPLFGAIIRFILRTALMFKRK